MLKFGFIGLGQVGGMFVDAVKPLGYPVLAVNTANVDLRNLEALEKAEKIHLHEYEGAGRDRSVGQEAFHTHQELIKDRIHEKMNDCHVIFPVFALGGGTGSGMGGLVIDMLTDRYDEKVISPILFMPDSDEASRSLMNALESFSEISAQEDIGSIFIFDNKKAYSRKEETLKEKFAQSKLELIRLLDLFNKRTGMKSEFSNFDEMDLLTVLSERGAAVISHAGIGVDHVESHEEMGKTLVSSWRNSSFAHCDYSNIARSALLVDIPSKLTTNLKIDTAFESIGRPLEVFSGIFESHDGRIYSLITGLPFPNDSLGELEENIEKNEKRISESLERARSQNYSAKSCWTVALKRKRKVGS